MSDPDPEDPAELPLNSSPTEAVTPKVVFQTTKSWVICYTAIDKNTGCYQIANPPFPGKPREFSTASRVSGFRDMSLSFIHVTIRSRALLQGHSLPEALP